MTNTNLEGQKTTERSGKLMVSTETANSKNNDENLNIFQCIQLKLNKQINKICPTFPL